MAYANTQELLKFLQEDETVELSQQGDMDALLARVPHLESILDSASDEIDTIIGGRFVVPAYTVVNGQNMAPKYLGYACKVIARKQIDLYSSREKVREDYDDVIGRLNGIANGKNALIGFDGQPIAERQVNANSETFMALGCV